MALDINSASLEDLAAIPGIDSGTAASIIEYRDENGGLSTLDDIRDIPGCTADTVTLLRDAEVTVGESTEAEAEGTQLM